MPDTRQKRRRVLCSVLICLLVLLLPVLAMASESGKVNASSLNMRKSASTKAKVIKVLKRGTSVTILSGSGSWYKIKSGGTTGYVVKSYITKSGSSKSSKSSNSTEVRVTKASGTGYATVNKLNLRSGPSTDAKVLKRLNQGNKVSILGISGSWYKVKAGSTTGFVSKSYISKSSKAASKGESGKTGKAERLNWFKNGSGKIPKGAVFQVKDIKTGKVFTVRRWSGANHIDAEPKTAKDTKILKSIFGHWSWRRRAVLVKYNGHVYAGSMNGMPHGTQTIKNNNFNGHFCIHFYGSKTHGSKKVDKTHQQCVETAMNYSW